MTFKELKIDIKKEIKELKKYERHGWDWCVGGCEIPAYYALAYCERFLKQLEECEACQQ